ncbi:MAG: DMT family transporter [Anaerolineales bacterium]|nr:DMT family transporter [Anaerolineales bacterium]
MRQINGRAMGISAALSAALFLGLAPIFGRQAILLGFSPLVVVAIRTSLAAAILLVLVALFRRPFLYIYPAGLLGCSLAGVINGLGSLLYYMALARLTASVGQLLYSLYPVFLAIWLAFDHQPPSKMTRLRIAVAILGVICLTYNNSTRVDWIGVGLMLGAAALYALHLPINQRVLYDIPAPTVTLYTLLAMSVIVVPAYFLFDRAVPATGISWGPVLCLTLVTFLSRLTLFLGVKHLGGMQTALLGLSELFVTIVVSHLWLHEELGLLQWMGALLLGLSLILIGFDRSPIDKRHKGGWLKWLRPPEIPPDISWGARD